MIIKRMLVYRFMKCIKRGFAWHDLSRLEAQYYMGVNYKRSIEELESNAVFWWPNDLESTSPDVPVIPLLLESQQNFISLLKLSGNGPFAIFDLIESAGFPGNMFLKHLAVVTDVGGEGLQRIGSEFDKLFPQSTESERPVMDFIWQEKKHRYEFKELPLTRGKLNNRMLKLDGPGLRENVKLTNLQRDVAVLLLHGASNLNLETAGKSDFFKCTVGSILGMSQQIEDFISQRYIWVSRITGGATANKLGQVVQTFAYDSLQKSLGSDFTITKNGVLKIEGQNLTSDILVSSKNGHSVGIEVSFQVTTNSTIERKGNEAESRMRLMHKAGHSVAYIIDGAGMFQRKSAVRKLCDNSDCTVAFSPMELSLLSAFIRGKLT